MYQLPALATRTPHSSSGDLFTRMTIKLLLLACAAIRGLGDARHDLRPRERALRIASYYSDHMVLQRGPQQAVLWGTAATEGDTVTAQVRGQGSPVTTTVHNGVWKLLLPAVTDPGPFVISVSSSEGDVTLNDVLFGDVWLCSGQSNMQFEMKQVMNSTAELQAARAVSTIRFMSSRLVKSNTPVESLDVEQTWALPSDPALAEFSAVCFLFAKSLQPYLNYPLGLVESSWGGTNIEAWAPPQAVNACPAVTYANPPACCPRDPSVLWNAMIYPLRHMTIFGALWYQGESNSGHPDEYSCMMQAMVREWRDELHKASLGQTRADFPFGYVQLAQVEDVNFVGDWPDLRWAQTAQYGYSPNPALPKTFMAVAMDLPDYTSPYGPIHPRYKHEVAERLTLGARNVAYGQSDVSFQGPFPSGFAADNAQHTLTIEFDHGRTPLDIRSNGGFDVFCNDNGSHGTWVNAPITAHDASHVTISTCGCGSRHLAGMRYAWRTAPCALKHCPVYAADTELPAPPYITYSIPV